MAHRKRFWQHKNVGGPRPPRVPAFVWTTLSYTFLIIEFAL